MTATRWWVQVGARWIARVDGVSSHLRLGMLALTGVSTAVVALESYGLQQWAPALVAVLAVGGAGFAWLYSEGGVWNQVQRDKRDLSRNHAHPGSRIDDEMIARGVVSCQQGTPLSESQRDAVTQELDQAFHELREGVDIDHMEDD